MSLEEKRTWIKIIKWTSDVNIYFILFAYLFSDLEIGNVRRWKFYILKILLVHNGLVINITDILFNKFVIIDIMYMYFAHRGNVSVVAFH